MAPFPSLSLSLSLSLLLHLPPLPFLPYAYALFAGARNRLSLLSSSHAAWNSSPRAGNHFIDSMSRIDTSLFSMEAASSPTGCCFDQYWGDICLYVSCIFCYIHKFTKIALQNQLTHLIKLIYVFAVHKNVKPRIYLHYYHRRENNKQFYTIKCVEMLPMLMVFICILRFKINVTKFSIHPSYQAHIPYIIIYYTIHRSKSRSRLDGFQQKPESD